MKILAITSRSVTLELETSVTPYFRSEPFPVKLNGAILREERRNVFSLFDLDEGEYCVEACGERAVFRTANPEACFCVTDFGAKGNGIQDDTGAFQSAIACLPQGGMLYVRGGTYLVRPIFLKSNMTLYLDRDAVLLGDPDRNHYPVLPGLAGRFQKYNLGTWQGEEADCFASLITACGQKNITVAGQGMIDCNAPAGEWYLNHRVMRGAWRPRGVYFNRCQNLLLQGITVKNTPSWNIHPYFCENVKLYDLKLENPTRMPTTDGIDPDCCDGVEIVGVDISVGDDCIAVKSGTLELAKKYRTPCKNIVIRNCRMREGHGGVVFGSELSGGIEDVRVNQCLFEGTDRGFRIKTRRGRGRIGKCDGVVFADIVMRGVKVPFVVNMYYNMGDESGHTEYVWTTEKLPVDDRTPEIGSLTFKNMDCTDVEYSAGAFYGLPESPITSVELENVFFSFRENAQAGYPDMREINVAVKKQGLDFHFVGRVRLRGVAMTGQEGDEVLLEEVPDFERKF